MNGKGSGRISATKYYCFFQIVVFLGKHLVAKKLEEYKRKFKKLRNFVLNSFFFLSIFFLDFVYLTWPFFSSLKCLCGFLMLNYLILYYYVSHMGANHANRLLTKYFLLVS